MTFFRQCIGLMREILLEQNNDKVKPHGPLVLVS